VCGNEHRFLVAEQLREIGLAPLGIMLEPLGRNTAPAVAAAAMYLQALDPEALMLVLPADHVITDVPRSTRRLTRRRRRRDGALATFGIVPTAPETGYGYIHAARRWRRRALQSTASSKSRTAPRPGICRRWQLLLEQRHVPVPRRHLSGANSGVSAMASASGRCGRPGYRDLDFAAWMKPRLLPARGFDRLCRDGAHPPCRGGARRYRLERCRLVVGAVGSAAADARQRQPWRRLSGRRQRFAGARRKPHRGRGGVKDLVVVETADAVLVAHKDQVQRVKQIVDHLTQQRTEHLHHTKVYRPWGCYEGIDWASASRSSASPSTRAASCRCRCTITVPSTGSWSAAPPA
jgi:mannose-1-phosphate guanylyltransferase/mannose-6-phosphate isomerase